MIFVTGGTGMLGSYLILELLRNGETVRASKRPDSPLSVIINIFNQLCDTPNQFLNQIEWVEVDLFNQNDIEEHLHQVTEIYHCAALISASTKQKNILVENNQIITQKLVDAALTKNISKFCHVSSIAALGNTGDNKKISETTLWTEHKSNSTYSTSKYKSEMEVWRGIAEGLNAVIINPSVILGIGDWKKGSANLFQKIDLGFKYYTYGSSGFVAAEDVAKIMTTLMSSSISFGQRYIVSAENITFKTLFDIISKALKAKNPNTYATPALTQLAWRLEWIKSKFTGIDPLITKESARTAHKKLLYNNRKLLNEIGFKYTPITEAIQNISLIYLKNKTTKPITYSNSIA